MGIDLPPTSDDRLIPVKRPSPGPRLEIATPESIRLYAITTEHLDALEMAVTDRRVEGAWGCLGAGTAWAVVAVDRLRSGYHDFEFHSVALFDAILAGLAVSFLVSALILGLSVPRRRSLKKGLIAKVRSTPVSHTYQTRRNRL